MLSETTQSTRIKVKSATMPITGGPSREELFDSLRLHTAARPCTVTFSAGQSTKFEVIISALEREDGSGQIWNFKGYIDHTPTLVRGSYSTRTRSQGTIELVH